MRERDLRRKLFWLIVIRVSISTLLLGSAVFVQLTSPEVFPGEPLFVLIGITYALNILWLVTLKWSERFNWIVDFQLACDALIVSGFIAVTGGITSYFAALYVLPIAAASSVQFRRGGMMIATLSALLYVGIVLTQYFELAAMLRVPFLSHGGVLPPQRIVAYTTGLNVFLFFSIAFLSGSLADRLQRAGVAPRAGVERDRRSAGVQSARDRQPGERPGHDGPSGADFDVQPRGRIHHRTSGAFGRRAPD